MIIGERFITSKQLNNNKIIRTRFIVNQNKKVIISGKITDKTGSPVPNAVIKIEKINFSFNPRKVALVGYSTTDVNGSYLLSIKKEPFVDFRLSVYQQVIK